MPTPPSLPLCEDPNALVPEVMGAWQALAAAEPWLSLPDEHRFDSLPDVVSHLLDAALCQPNDATAYRAKVEVAAKHGTDRRVRGFEQDLLFAEFHLLRGAIWDVVRRHYPAAVDGALLRVDAAISAATRASLYGFHRAELQRAGQWPGILERIVSESPLLAQQATPPAAPAT